MATKESFDATILEYQQQLAFKEAELAKVTGFKPKTNCSLTLNNIHYNIQTLDEVNLGLVLANVQALTDGFGKHFPENDLIISGYSSEKWISDLKGLYEKLSVRKRQAEISTMKAELNELLSDDAKKDLRMKALMDKMKSL